MTNKIFTAFETLGLCVFQQWMSPVTGLGTSWCSTALLTNKLTPNYPIIQYNAFQFKIGSKGLFYLQDMLCLGLLKSFRKSNLPDSISILLNYGTEVESICRRSRYYDSVTRTVTCCMMPLPAITSVHTARSGTHSQRYAGTVQCSV